MTQRTTGESATVPAGARSGGRAPRRSRNPFGSLFGSSRQEQFLVRYVLQEHARGRPLGEIFEDPYVRNRSTAEERARVFEHPEVVAAVGQNVLEELRRSGGERGGRGTTAAPTSDRRPVDL
jgi:hypothetical protein